MSAAKTWRRLIALTLGGCAVSLSVPAAFAKEDIKAEIINRCRQQMGEYGSALVKACVDQDIEAAIALGKYDEQYKSILARCLRDMRSYGFALVKACADQDIQAENALRKY